MSLVLTNNLDLRGGTGALEILENAAILNRSTLIDLSGVVPVSGAKASWNMSEDLTVRGGSPVERGGRWIGLEPWRRRARRHRNSRQF